jgi:hypothetical protein
VDGRALEVGVEAVSDDKQTVRCPTPTARSTASAGPDRRKRW